MSKKGITKKARLMQIMPKAPNNLGSNYLIKNQIKIYQLSAQLRTWPWLSCTII